MIRKRDIINVFILTVLCMVFFGNTSYSQSTLPIRYYDYYTMSMGDTKIAVLNVDPKSNALFLHNPAGLSYISKKKKKQWIRMPFQLIMRTINPRRKDIYEWGTRKLQTWYAEARIINAIANTNDWQEIQDMSESERMDNMLARESELEGNAFYDVYYEELGYLLQGYWELYSGQYGLNEIYEYNDRFKDHMEEQQEGTDYLKSKFYNMEMVARLDTRTTFGVLGRMIDGLLGLDDTLENMLSWDFGISGFLHPRIESLLSAHEGPYMPYWYIDLEADVGYSLGISKKINFDLGYKGNMPVSLGFRYNKLYRFALDSYLTPSTILSTLFDAGTLSNEEMIRVLGEEIVDTMVLGTADSMDLGILVEPPDMPLLLGFVIKDIGDTKLYEAEIAGDKIVSSDIEVGGIPQTFNFGASYRTTLASDLGERDLLVAMDVRDIGIPNESIFLKLHFGAEYELKQDSVWLRGGINQGYITYGISALVKIAFFKLYFEASKYEAEQYGSRLPGIHTSDPFYTYRLNLRLTTPLPIRLKKQMGEEDMYF